MKSKKAAALWISGLVLIGAAIGATRLWAQSDAPKFGTAAEAAQGLVFALTSDFNPHSEVLSLFSRRYSDLQSEAVPLLLKRFFYRAQLSRFKTQTIPGESADRSTVLIEPTESLQLPPIICVREDGGWKIDLLETSRKWFGATDVDVVALDQELRGEFPEPIALQRCASNLKQIGLALAIYSQDWDEKMPPADKWVDVLKPFMSNEKPLHAPEVGKEPYGYSMNWKLSRQPLAAITQPANTVAHYETNIFKRNNHFDGRDLVFRHTVDQTLGANYAFVDGHVKWIPQRETQNFRLKTTATKR